MYPLHNANVNKLGKIPIGGILKKKKIHLEGKKMGNHRLKWRAYNVG